jgi:hypothetical protein
MHRAVGEPQIFQGEVRADDRKPRHLFAKTVPAPNGPTTSLFPCNEPIIALLVGAVFRDFADDVIDGGQRDVDDLDAFVGHGVPENDLEDARPNPNAGSGSPIAADSPKMKTRIVFGGLTACITTGCGVRSKPGGK